MCEVHTFGKSLYARLGSDDRKTADTADGETPDPCNQCNPRLISLCFRSLPGQFCPDLPGIKFLKGDVQDLGEGGDFRVLHTPDLKLNPGNDVPRNVPTRQLAFRCHLGLRPSELVPQPADLRPADIEDLFARVKIHTGQYFETQVYIV